MGQGLLTAAATIDSTTALGVGNDATYRVAFDTSGFISDRYATHVYIRLGHAGSNDFTFDKCYIGLSAANGSGNRYDFLGTPTQVTFEGGNSGATVTADLKSDVVEFAFDPAYTYLVSIHITDENPANNYVHHDTATLSWAQSYKKAGDVCSDEAWAGGPDSTYADTAYVCENFIENDPLTLDENLPEFTGSATTEQQDFLSLTSTLPDVQITATTTGRLFMWEPAVMPAFEIEAKSGERCTLDEDIINFELSVQMGARCDTDLKLPVLTSDGTILAGNVGTLSESLPTLALAAQTGAILDGTMPIPSLSVTASGDVLGTLTKDLPGLTIIADGGRVGMMDLSEDLPPLSITGEILGFQSTLIATLSALKIQASMLSGDGADLSEWLSHLEGTGTITETPYITLDKNLPPLVMGAVSTGADDGAGTDGASGGQTTRFSTTVLRHERYP